MKFFQSKTSGSHPQATQPAQAFTLALGFALALAGGASTAHAQYTITGATAGGGEIIVGNGSLDALGAATSPVALSAGGFDNVTLSIGSIATTASGQDTIAFVTSNNTFTNNGAVIGASGDIDVSGNSAVSFNGTTLTGETIINHGALIGGQGGNGLDNGTNGGAGISVIASDTLGSITINNTGVIAGGAGNGSQGRGRSAIEISGGIVDNVSVTNSGNITGGDAPFTPGYGIRLGSDISMSNITLTNSGNITGGSASLVNGTGNFGVAIISNGAMTNVAVYNSGNIAGGNAGRSTLVGLLINSGSDMANVLVENTGTIAGGSGTFTPGQTSSGRGSTGVSVAGGNFMTNIAVTNSGVMEGGSGYGNGSDGSNPIGRPGGAGGTGFNAGNGNTGGGINGFTLTNNNLIIGGAGTGNGGAGGSGATGGSAGTGGIGASFDFASGVSNDISVINNGVIVGGAGTGDGGTGGDFAPGGTGGTGGIGIEFVIENGASASGITLVNNGSITGGAGNGNGGDGGDAIISSYRGGNAGVGGNGIEFFLQSGAAGGISLVNNGSITGGNGTGTGGLGFVLIFSSITGTNGAGGNGVAFLTGTGAGVLTDASVTNFGHITGGNGDKSTNGPAGAGIFANTGNVTINNWGAIAAGNGSSLATVPGFPAAAIVVSGNNNTINLNGHSSVAGTIEGANGGVNNVLNLNFTGMSPLEIANLKAQLAAQGWPGSNDFTGAFIVRGVTYYVDPLILNVNVSSYQLQGLTPNQQAIGASLDSALVNPAPGTPLFNLFNAIDQSGNVSAALAALSPQNYQVYGDLAIQNATDMVQNVDARLNNLRDGSESIDTTGIGGASDRTTSGFSKGGDGKESKEVVQPSAPEKRWGFFATGNGLFFRGGSHDVDLQQAKANTAGALAGVDAKIGEHFVGGALFAYDNSDVQMGGNGSKATIESYTGGLYGAYHQDGFYVNGLAAYTSNHYSSLRNINIPGFINAANGSTHGNQYSANLDGGYDFHVTDRVTAGPLVGVQYVHLDVNSFNEWGAGAGSLAVGSQSMDSLQSRVGGRVDYHLLTSNVSSFAAEVHAAWQHEYLNDSRAIGASFENSGLAPFSIQTSSPRRDAGVVGAGLNFTFHDRLTLFAGYELQMWSTSYFEQSVNGGARISF